MATPANKLYQELMKRPPKYGNKTKVVIDGYSFDSLGESNRYGELRLLARTKQITDLQVHPCYPIIVNGHRICVYEADFCYLDKQGKLHVEDFKGAKTALYNLKKKLVFAVLGIEIEEVRKR